MSNKQTAIILVTVASLVFIVPALQYTVIAMVIVLSFVIVTKTVIGLLEYQLHYRDKLADIQLKERNVRLVTERFGSQLAVIEYSPQGHTINVAQLSGSTPQSAPKSHTEHPTGLHSELLATLAQATHILIIGSTGTGKTNLAQAFCEYVSPDSDTYAVSPHILEGEFVASPIGLRGDYQAIEAHIASLHTLMLSRIAERTHGSRFRKVVTILDELPAIVAHREFGDSIKSNLQELIMQARKVNITLVLLSQSKNVRALGIEGLGDIVEGLTKVITKRSQDGYQAIVIEGDNQATFATLPYQPRLADNTTQVSLPEPVLPAKALSDTELLIIAEYQNNPAISLNRLCELAYGSKGGKQGELVKSVLSEAGIAHKWVK